MPKPIERRQQRRDAPAGGADTLTNTGLPQGNTLPAQGQTQDPVPRLPHERDESADSQAPAPAALPQGRVAHDDVSRGLVDTDRRPPMERAYAKLRQGADMPVKK